MKITIEPTTKVIELKADGSPALSDGIKARVWEGTTDKGVPVVVLVTRITPNVDPSDDSAHEDFRAALKSVRAPSVEVQAWPLRLVL